MANPTRADYNPIVDTVEVRCPSCGEESTIEVEPDEEEFTMGCPVC